ncbi:Aste57867_20520 [Aphanomyces stellatus]|uniref:Conserved oligomeric Golgi complex subunit 7 n=1 Tax=Aphanomyces stellatus TaxID=120398 RepID=A0A485LGC6_9STRA|nr:hypothetical protein As57867_020453 [Aphanomyces stellatus]VFT97205.1 Aste57867_20520 [Aphanomyces stellatus]
MESVVSAAELGTDVTDVYAWVDAQTVKSSDKTKLEGLLPQLHVLSQELSATLQQRLETFPSFGNHVQLLAIKTTTLQQSLQVVPSLGMLTCCRPSWHQSPRTDATPTDDNSTNPFLVQLHDAKTHMHQCIHALEESAAWKQHSRLVAQALEDSSSPPPLPTLATHLTAMNKSLRILESMPGANERQVTMAQLSRQVEAMVLPHLQSALAEPSVNIASLSDFLAIFQCLGRADAVSRSYAKARPASIHRLWLSLQTAPPPLDLAAFYQDTHLFLTREWQTIQSIFGDDDVGRNVWLALLAATLQPCSIATHVTIDNVSTCFELSVRFGHQLLTELTAWDATAAQSILHVVFDAYWPLLQSFAAVERQAREPQVRALVPTIVDADVASRIDDATATLWALVESRTQFGISFACGALLPATIDALTQLLALYEAALVALQGDLQELLHHGSTMDWGVFHTALNLVKSTGALLLNAQAMQTRFTLRLQDPLAAWLSTEDEDAVPAFTLADCADVATLPKAVMKIWWRDQPGKYRAVETLHHALSYKPVLGHLFQNWTHTVQLLMYESVLGPIQHTLLPLATMDTWIEAESDQALPSFSTLPKEYITVVADILLSLLPQLELFAESSGLAQAMAASNEMELLNQGAWAKVAAQLRVVVEPDMDLSQENFVDRWTMTIASGTMALLTAHVFKIPRFSTLGAQQLACDLGYFQNVLMALGLNLHPILQHVHHTMLRQPCACMAMDATTREKLDASFSFI